MAKGDALGGAWWLGLLLNVCGTFFLLGDLLSEELFKRLLTASVIIGAVTIATAATLQVALHGSVVNGLSAWWGQHSAARLALASATLAIAPFGLIAVWRVRELKSARWMVALPAIFYAVTVLRVFTAVPYVFSGGTQRVPLGQEWMIEQPSLAIHWVYATASLWGVVTSVFLPLVAGHQISRTFSRLSRDKAFLRWANICVLLISWALQIGAAL